MEQDIIATLQLQHVHDPIDGDDQYDTIDNSVSIYTEYNKIISVECNDVITYNGVNIIDLPHQYAQSFIGGEWTIEPFVNQLQIDCESLRITLWVSDGFVSETTVWGSEQ